MGNREKAVFLDRDGTINVEKHYLYRQEDFEFLPGVPEGLRLLQRAGFRLIVVTNQSGIGRGYYSEADFLKLTDWMVETLASQYIIISRVYYCPHLPEAEIIRYRKVCSCRKPALGMFRQAVRDFEIDLSASYAVGDRLRDCSICLETDCKGYLIGQSEEQDIVERVKAGEYNRVSYKENLYECALDICMNSSRISGGEKVKRETGSIYLE